MASVRQMNTGVSVSHFPNDSTQINVAMKIKYPQYEQSPDSGRGQLSGSALFATISCRREFLLHLIPVNMHSSGGLMSFFTPLGDLGYLVKPHKPIRTMG